MRWAALHLFSIQQAGSSVASSSITVAGTTFSITIAALSLASSQFGPRLLRTFVRDTGNQVVLGTFVATFLTLARVGEAAAEEWRRVPLLRQAQLTYEGSLDALPTDGDRQTLAERYRDGRKRLDGAERTLGHRLP